MFSKVIQNSILVNFNLNTDDNNNKNIFSILLREVINKISVIDINQINTNFYLPSQMCIILFDNP